MKKDVSTRLDIGRGEFLELPARNNLLGGITIPRIFSKAGIHPYDEVAWDRRKVEIMDYAKGRPSYLRENVEVPSHWADNAVRITSSKYLFGSVPNTPQYEDSIRHPFDRISNTYTVWGWRHGYFATQEDALIFNWEVKAMLVKQMWAPNSPVWFNIGHWEQWRWGRPDLSECFSNRGNKAFKAEQVGDHLEVREIDNVYEHPQASACFLTEVDDCMEAILEHGIAEGRIFASGSGVGINLSTMRSSQEPIGGKGRSSGPVAFDKGWDRMAGAIKSGGKTRRAARMVLMDSDHPDVFEFLNVKAGQDRLAKIILREHSTHVALKALALEKSMAGNSAEMMAANIILSLPLVTDAVYDGGMDDLVYGETVAHQNANHSISLLADFWKAFHSGANYSSRWITVPDKIGSTFRAEELLRAMANACWENAEPGCHNNDWINLWSTYKDVGRLTTSNPCSEYIAPNNTSCNLSSFNIYRFYDFETKRFNTEALEHGSLLAMIVADLNVEEGGFPIPEIASGTYTYRTTGIGYANLGGLIMALGMPYDSNEGRLLASQLVSLLTASCWKASAQMGAAFGGFFAQDIVLPELRRVIALHTASQRLSMDIPGICNGALSDEAGIDRASKDLDLPSFEGITGRNALQAQLRAYDLESPLEATDAVLQLSQAAAEAWDSLVDVPVFRNSFVTCIAPTGTISSPLGVYDEGTTSAEPDYTLVKYKNLSGGGMLRMFNTLALKALHTMGYSDTLVREAALEVAGVGSLLDACKSVGEAANHLAKPLTCEPGPVRVLFEAAAADADRHAVAMRICSNLSKGNSDGIDPLLANGSSHIESVPWLDPKHLPVFDCSDVAGDGVRSIHASGHMRMLAALQPFISGATSKTVNLPGSATRDDIYQCFVDAHEMGVKCIALYRSESKGVSVFQTSGPEGRRWQLDNVWNGAVEACQEEVSRIKTDAAKPFRRKLPGLRTAQVVKFDIGSQLDGFLIVGLYPDGTCGEVFGRLGQGGSFAHGMFESFCKAFSAMLQWGVPLDQALKSFKNTAFDPAGFVKVGDSGDYLDVRSCKSVVDLMMQILSWLFPASNSYVLRDFGGVAVQAQIGDAKITLEPGQSISTAMDGPGSGDLSSAETCPVCHSLSLIQDGKCRRCRNCDYTGGGCG